MKGTAFFISENITAFLQPSYCTVRPHSAVFNIIFIPVVNTIVNSVENGFSVLRMYGIYKVLVTCFDFSFFISEKRGNPLRPKQFSG
jgi:hypothetical protein